MVIKKADIRPEKLHICSSPFPQRSITTEDYQMIAQHFKFLSHPDIKRGVDLPSLITICEE